MPQVNNFHGTKSIIHFVLLILYILLHPAIMHIHTHTCTNIIQALNSNTWVSIFTLRHAEWFWEISFHIFHIGLLRELGKILLNFIHSIYYLYSKISNMPLSFTCYTPKSLTRSTYIASSSFYFCIALSKKLIVLHFVKMTIFKIQNLSCYYSA